MTDTEIHQGEKIGVIIVAAFWVSLGGEERRRVGRGGEGVRRVGDAHGGEGVRG